MLAVNEHTIGEWGGAVPIGVLEGDQATSADAERIRAAGANAVQINAGSGCHLDAHMVAHGRESLRPPRDSLLLIENVGNLICPALFDLGEQARVVVMSVTEGDDKPLKYPHMFRAGHLCGSAALGTDWRGNGRWFEWLTERRNQFNPG